MYKKLSIFIIAMNALWTAERANGATIEYYSTYEYLSRTQVHFTAIGIRAQFSHVTLELSNGVKKAQRNERAADKPSNGTLLGIHIYPFHTPDKQTRFVLSAIHLSDIFRGKPFNGKAEPVDHFFGAGYTIQRNDYEFDILFGKESHDCALDSNCTYSNQFKATIRYIF